MAHHRQSRRREPTAAAVKKSDGLRRRAERAKERARAAVESATKLTGESRRADLLAKATAALKIAKAQAPVPTLSGRRRRRKMG
jgi:hypothetical protein